MRIALLLIGCLYSFAGSSQVFFFNHVSQEDGLRNGNIRTIIKAHQGFMWIGTEDGLHRYDGYEMKLYRNRKGDSTSLGSNTILCLFEDSYKNIWVGTLDGGLYCYNRKKDSFRKFTLPAQTHAAPNVAIRCIMEGADHYLYVGFERLVRAKVDSAGAMSFQHVPLPTDSIQRPGVRVNAMAKGPDSTLLISVNTQGLFAYDYTSGRCRPHETNTLEKNVQAIYADVRRNLLWIGSWRNGLLIYDPVTKKHRRITSGPGGQSLKSNFISAIAADTSGDTWIATENGVSILSHRDDPFNNINIITLQSGRTNPSGIRGVAFKALYVDDQSKVWIGSYYEGINVYDRNAMNFGSVDMISEGNATSGSGNVNALQEDKEGNLWIGLDGGGMYKLQGELNSPGASSIKRMVVNPEIDKVKTLALDHNQNLWIGTWADGLWKLDIRTMKSTKVNPQKDIGSDIVSLETDRAGNLWIGSFDRGLFRYQPEIQAIEKISGVEPNGNFFERTHAIYADSVGNVWIGKEAGGLNVLRRGQSAYTTINTAHLDKSTTITTIFQDAAGTLWLGIPTLGLVAYNAAENQSYVYGEDAGLVNSAVYAIEEDGEGRLWLSHNAGLSTFNKQTKRFTNFAHSNGITAAQFNRNSSVKRKSGQIIFGNIHGLNYFLPDDFHETTTQVPIMFTKLLINNIEQVPGGGVLQDNIVVTRNIKLAHHHNAFSIQFAALNYNFSNQAEYYYRLYNFDDTWQYAGSRRLISYTNLPPGEYVCEVRVGNGQAGPQAMGRMLITIVPAWWQTTLFKIAVLGMFIVSIFVLHRLRVGFLVRQRRQLEREVTARTKDLNETVEEVKTMNSQLQEQREEIIEQSNEIQTQNEELLSQNEHIAKQHEVLEEAQEQLKLINLKLEQTVEQRTETLQKTIENLNKVVFELDRFVYSASHDLNAPLKSILGLVHIINIEEDPAKIMEYVGLIKNTVLKLDAVIKSMVDYARNSHVDIKTERINLYILVDEIMDELAFLPESALITFQNQVPRDIVVQNDRMRLKVVFSNLLGNSVKYRDKNKETSWIRIEAQNFSTDWTRIKITDNGIGIHPQFVDKIFNMYFRATELAKGSGLGLFIVKEMVNKVGGHITVTTEMGEWTTFELRIPKIPMDE